MKYIAYSLLLILLIINVFLIIRFREERGLVDTVVNQANELVRSINNYKLESSELRKKYQNQILVSGVNLKNTVLRTIENKEFRISDLGGETPKLFFQFSLQSCNKCVEDQLKLLDEVELLTNDSVILLIKTNDLKDLYFFKENYTSKANLYAISYDGIDMFGNSDDPIYFTLDKLLYVNNFYAPLNEDENLTRKYLHIVNN